MTKEELEREYYSRRPTEPYSEDDNPNDWANIVQYAEENLDKAFKTIAELEKENAELNEKLEVIEKKRDYWKESSFDWRHKCTSKKSFRDAVKAQKQLTKAKEIIKKFLGFANNTIEFDPEHPQEHTDLWDELCEKAEQFLNEARAMERSK